MEPIHVLVAEDKPGVLKLVATILRERYRVTTAADGATAMALIGSAEIDVVLTDVRMPGASGFDVLRAVQGRTAPATVVMMTAYANVRDAVAAIRLGAFDYVAKPLDADELSLVVARAVEHRRAGAERPAVGALPGADPAAPEEGERDVSVGFHRAVEQARRRASVEYLTRLMNHFRGNVTHAAAQAGMTRESLHRLLKQYGIRSEPYRERARGESEDGERNPGDDVG